MQKKLEKLTVDIEIIRQHMTTDDINKVIKACGRFQSDYIRKVVRGERVQKIILVLLDRIIKKRLKQEELQEEFLKKLYERLVN